MEITLQTIGVYSGKDFWKPLNPGYRVTLLCQRFKCHQIWRVHFSQSCRLLYQKPRTDLLETDFSDHYHQLPNSESSFQMVWSVIFFPEHSSLLLRVSLLWSHSPSWDSNLSSSSSRKFSWSTTDFSNPPFSLMKSGMPLLLILKSVAKAKILMYLLLFSYLNVPNLYNFPQLNNKFFKGSDHVISFFILPTALRNIV